METLITAIRRIRSAFPPKLSMTGFQVGSADPPCAASGHRLRLGCCLVGPDVRWSASGLGWSVWSGLWASFACVTQDAIICDFVCVFVVFSSYSGYGCLQSKNHQNLWNWLELSPTATFGGWILWKDVGDDGLISDLRTVNNTPTLSLCSSSSKEAKTKVDATPLKKPAYKLFLVSPWLVNFLSVYMLILIIETWNGLNFRFLSLSYSDTWVLWIFKIKA